MQDIYYIYIYILCFIYLYLEIDIYTLYVYTGTSMFIVKIETRIKGQDKKQIFTIFMVKMVFLV